MWPWFYNSSIPPALLILKTYYFSISNIISAYQYDRLDIKTKIAYGMEFAALSPSVS